MSRALVLCNVLAVLVLAGCPNARTEGLIVNVQTDLHAGVEFDSVVLTVDGAMTQRVPFNAQDSFSRPRFVANYRTLSPGVRTLRVALVAGSQERAVRTIQLPFVDSYLVTAVITRNCVDFPCGSLSCAGARCVPLDCVTGDEPSCPVRQCSVDADCATGTACAEAVCAAGVCLQAPNDARCMSSEVCVVGRGCIPRPSAADAGVVDASDAVALSCITPMDCPGTYIERLGPCAFADPCTTTGAIPLYLWSATCTDGVCGMHRFDGTEACTRPSTDGATCTNFDCNNVCMGGTCGSHCQRVDGTCQCTF